MPPNNLPVNTTTRPRVFLRGDRNYVQGTQMIARAAELLTGWTFCQSRFDRITDAKIQISFQKPDDRLIGSCTHAFGADKREVFFSCIDEMAERVDEKMRPQLSGDGERGHFTFANASSFEDLLNVLVQSVKTSHQQIGSNLSDIWLSGMRNFLIPHDCCTKTQRGTVETKLLRVLRTSSAHQSLWQVKLSSQYNLSFDGIITFAFKSPSAT